MKVIKIIALSLVVFFTFLLSQGFAQRFDSAVAFGDSLSDNGNIYQLSFSQVPDPDFYYEGRFSNGPVWVEYLTGPDLLNVPLTDMAYGGAETDIPGLLDQVTIHIASTSPASAQTLFIIWMGSNDYLNSGTDYVITVGNIITAMSSLADDGVRHFLVANLANLGVIPDLLGSAEAPIATAYSLNFNAELASMVDQFRLSHPQVTIYLFDAYTLFEEIRSNPAAFGFSNVTTPSPNFAVADNFDNSAGHLFWDDIHPTTEAHAVIADRAFSILPDQNVTPSAVAPAADRSSESSCFIAALFSR